MDLPSINGSNVRQRHGLRSFVSRRRVRWLLQAEIAAAMTLEALKANMKPYDGPSLHEAARIPRRSHLVPNNIRRVIEGSDLTDRQRIQGAKCRTRTACARRPR